MVGSWTATKEASHLQGKPIQCGRADETFMAWTVAAFPVSSPAGFRLPLDTGFRLSLRILKCLQFPP